MTTPADTADRIALALRQGYAHLDGRGPDKINEAVTRSVLIDRILDELGYPPTHRQPENPDRGDRPDDLCYLQPVGRAPGHPALVLEAKKLDTDFDRTPKSAARVYSPDRQIQRYLENNRISGPHTIGVLTAWQPSPNPPPTPSPPHPSSQCSPNHGTASVYTRRIY